MVKNMHKMIPLALLGGLLFGIVACDDKGPAQKTGESIDNDAQKMKDAVDPPGPAEKAGRAVDKATGNN